LFATSASPIGSVVPERSGVSHTAPIFRDNTPRKSGVLPRITFPLQHAAKAAFRKSARSRQWRGQAGATEFVFILLGEDTIKSAHDKRFRTALVGWHSIPLGRAEPRKVSGSNRCLERPATNVRHHPSPSSRRTPSEY